MRERKMKDSTDKSRMSGSTDKSRKAGYVIEARNVFQPRSGWVRVASRNSLLEACVAYVQCRWRAGGLFSLRMRRA